MVYNFFEKKSSGSGVCMEKIKLNNIINYLKNYTNQLLKNFKKEQFILDLKTI